MTQKRYEKEIEPVLIRSIPSTIQMEHKTALKSKIKYGYEYSLRKRLNDIYKIYCTDMGVPFNSIRIDIGKIIDTRNYLVHQDNSLKGNASSGYELLRLTRQLKKIIEYLMLKELGLNNMQIKSNLSNHYSGS